MALLDLWLSYGYRAPCACVRAFELLTKFIRKFRVNVSVWSGSHSCGIGLLAACQYALLTNRKKKIFAYHRLMRVCVWVWVCVYSVPSLYSANWLLCRLCAMEKIKKKIHKSKRMKMLCDPGKQFQCDFDLTTAKLSLWHINWFYKPVPDSVHPKEKNKKWLLVFRFVSYSWFFCSDFIIFARQEEGTQHILMAIFIMGRGSLEFADENYNKLIVALLPRSDWIHWQQTNGKSNQIHGCSRLERSIKRKNRNIVE